MRPALASAPALVLALLTLIGGCSAQVRYFGKELGPLSALQHGVRGTVYAVDSRTLYIHDFHYDGEGPAAYFYMGSSGEVRTGSGAVRLRDERGGAGPLRKYRGEHITLSLPDGKTLRDYKWFSVYCDEYEVNFGDVTIPRGVEYPRPAKVGALRGVHGVSSDSIVIVDAQTILVPNFSYDGEAPDAKFWVGRGDKPSPQGIRIPDENGKETPLRRYDKKTIVLTLPGELTVFDIGHFAVWCEAFTVNFGHVSLPRAALAAVPPSLKMLGVSPQSRNRALVGVPQEPAGHAAAPHRPRRPIAHLDATTYRPPARLRPGASLLTSLQHEPYDRLTVHRRANTNTPPEQQLEQSKDVEYHNNGDANYDQQYVQQEHQQEKQQQQERQQQQQHELNQQERDNEYYQDKQQQEEVAQLHQYQYESQQQKYLKLQQQQKESMQQHHQDQQRQQDSNQQQQLTPEQHYQQLVLQQRLLEQELQQRQQQLEQAQRQLHRSQEPLYQQERQELQYFTEPVQTQQQLYQQSQHREEPQQYRLLPFASS